MTTGMKSAAAGVLLAVMAAGVAFAADCCCCKAEPCKMECCDKDKAGKTTAPAEEHKH